jgi:predicted Zn finger-like uncharacterized protein
MILTCPSCSVRYLVDARALGTSGRMVRCAKCAHTWRQAPPDEGAPPPPPTAQAESPAPAAPAQTTEAALRDIAPALVAQRRVQLPAVPRPPRRWGPLLAGAASAFVVVAGLVAAAVVERDRIVAFYPASAALYARIGFPASDNGVGLEFRNVTTARDMANGLPALVIDGEVINVSSVARAVPKLVVILRDRSERDLQDVTLAAPAARLLPGETAAFHTTITQPAETAAGVVVTFAAAGRS